MGSPLEKTERNRSIALRVLRGESFSSLAREHAISRERVRQILHNYCKERNEPAYFLSLSQTRLSAKKRLVRRPSIEALRAKLNDFVGAVEA